MIVIGDEFMDSGVHRTVNSVSRSENWTTVVCSDGTLIRAANSRQIKLLNPRMTVRPTSTGVEPSPPREAGASAVPTQNQAQPEAVTTQDTSTATSDSADSSKSPVDHVAPATTITSPSATQRLSTTAPTAQTPVFDRELSSTAPTQLATITQIVEVILWVLLGLTLIGAIIAAAQTNSLCDSIKGGGCESRPFIVPAIAAAAIGTAFYLFGIAIMRAIRLWAQRIAAGLPV